MSLYYTVNFTLFTSMFFTFSDILSNLFDLKGCVFKCPMSQYLVSLMLCALELWVFSVRGPEWCDLSIFLVNI